MDTLTTEQADLIRITVKELRWAALNLEKFYNMSKPAESPAISKPENQLEMFQDGEEET